ncbi:hypothetical protein [Endozoicomonas sp. ALB115]|uniref:hypothetical protein n=1 Tax=Endozoicomonas sp. ALB115 TaxID=3403074 RepID=UPI003BB6E116
MISNAGLETTGSAASGTLASSDLTKKKESFKWQQSSESIEHRLGAQMTRVVSVCDREADVYEYIQYKTTHSQRFVVRATQNRILIGDNQLLFDALAEEPTLGDSKRTGVSGWLVVWDGWAKLQDRLHTYRMTKGVEI